MKIYGNKPPDSQDALIKAQKTGKSNVSRVEKKTGAAAGRVSDRVNLSGKAKEISELKKTINQLPDIRTDKVESVKKAVAAGTYEVDPLKVAGKLIDEII